MSKARHTPGPWEVVRSSQGYPYGIQAPNGNRGPGGIVNVTRWAAIGFPSSDEGEANALLMAAAPDLLVALNAARNHAIAWQGEPNEFSCDIHRAIITQIDVAIAKATHS